MLKAEATQWPEANLRRQQQRFDWFQKEYNEERPHEALGQVPPAMLYLPSGRTYRRREGPLAYPAADRQRRVRTSGDVYLRGQYLYLGGVRAGEQAGLAAGPGQPGRWEVWFGPVLPGVLDEQKGKVDPPPRPQGRGRGRGDVPGKGQTATGEMTG